jgi:hypothetical protein
MQNCNNFFLFLNFYFFFLDILKVLENGINFNEELNYQK